PHSHTRLDSTRPLPLLLLFFFPDTSPPAIYPLSLHDALPIYRLDLLRGALELVVGEHRRALEREVAVQLEPRAAAQVLLAHLDRDRKSTRLNSSHLGISYAVFCLKKKKNKHFNQ